MSAVVREKAVTPPMVCRGCGTRARGPVQPGWIDVAIRDTETRELEECRAYCGFNCLTRGMTMIDPTARELEALQKAGYEAGGYLESLQKTDLSTLSEDEWMIFLQCIVSVYQEKLAGVLDADVPF